MKNETAWRPSKYVFNKKSMLRASRNESHVALSSRHLVDLLGGVYGRLVPEFAKGSLLDLGCGKVPLYQAYRPYVDQITCADWGQSLHESNHIDIECDLNEILPFPNNSFDTILLSDVLEHLPNPESTLKEITRVLAPDGHLLISVPFLYWLHEEPYDFYRYTRHALQRFIDNSGLVLVRLEALGSAFDVLVDITSKCTARLPFIGRSIARTINLLGRTIPRGSRRDHVVDSAERRFPLEYVVVAKKPAPQKLPIPAFNT